ncbi:skin secretory protein xP2-like [Suricata suricatta]|uniref:skin secretory protein xP2-like n=1 Tax=Suricata suricatta TaxID=37032 RepID=UPI0011558F46|nr:skin secretory protein xP2-like [Suricata suricatta]
MLGVRGGRCGRPVPAPLLPCRAVSSLPALLDSDHQQLQETPGPACRPPDAGAPSAQPCPAGRVGRARSEALVPEERTACLPHSCRKKQPFKSGQQTRLGTTQARSSGPFSSWEGSGKGANAEPPPCWPGGGGLGTPAKGGMQASAGLRREEAAPAPEAAHPAPAPCRRASRARPASASAVLRDGPCRTQGETAPQGASPLPGRGPSQRAADPRAGAPGPQGTAQGEVTGPPPCAFKRNE